LNTDSYSYKIFYLNWLVSNDDQRREGNARLQSKTGKGIRREVFLLCKAIEEEE